MRKLIVFALLALSVSWIAPAFAQIEIVVWSAAADQHRGDRLKFVPKSTNERGWFLGGVEITSETHWWYHGGSEAVVDGKRHRGTYTFDPKLSLVVITVDEATLKYRLEGNKLIDTSTGEVVWADE